MKWEKRKADRIHLSEPERQALLAIAEAHDCNARSGATAGEPSYRILIQEIAAGRLSVISRRNAEGDSAKKEKKGKKEKGPWKGFWKFRAKWWEPTNEKSTMMTDEAVEASGMTVDQLTGGGLILVADGAMLQCPDRWKGWVWRKSDEKATKDSEPEPMPEAPMCDNREMSHIRDMTGG